jgi:hypothetical protein
MQGREQNESRISYKELIAPFEKRVDGTARNSTCYNDVTMRATIGLMIFHDNDRISNLNIY